MCTILNTSSLISIEGEIFLAFKLCIRASKRHGGKSVGPRTLIYVMMSDNIHVFCQIMP